MKPVELFTKDVHTFWATTYQFDLKLFDQFLLRRLGNQPLNAVVLADEDNVTDALVGLTEVDVHVAANANRRYVLRGMRPSSGGRFHPKTYLFSSRRQTVLLVGSGNLTRNGLDRGREVFCAYSGGSPADVSVIRAWATWIGELVNERADEQLRRRYDRLRTVISGLSGPDGAGEFVTNRVQSLIEAVLGAAPCTVEEMHVTAPYFDQHAVALEELLHRTQPTRSLHLYLGARTNVDGGSLRGVLERLPCRVLVHRYEPTQFVHAKLIGLTGADGTGVLLCGSPNLSRAALTLTYSTPDSHGNCEAAVLRRGPVADVLAAFRPPESTLETIALDEVAGIRFESEEPSSRSLAIRLLSAELTPDARIRAYTPCELPIGVAVAWAETGQALWLSAAAVTEDALADGDEPLIVWLVDETGEICSNRVVLDDPMALDDVLGERGGVGDRPAEIADEDERSDLVALLSWAHQQFIFDLDDTPATGRANNAQDQQTDADDTDFWERHVREELTYDLRSQNYRPLSHTSTFASTDLLLREIKAMLNAAPHERMLRVVRGDDKPLEEHASGNTWSFSARQRLRARNLLRRWARALADPRHAWISPDAPAINYTGLVDVLTLIWLGDALDEATIVKLLEEVWTALLGTEGRKGLIDIADDELRETLLRDVSDDTRQLAAGLAYSALHRSRPWKHRIYDWQPFLQRGIETGLFAAGQLSSDLAAALLDDVPPTPTAIEDLLLERTDWVDDSTWGKRIAAELGLQYVAILPRAGYKNVDLVVTVEGMRDPGRDSRAVILARRAMALKQRDHVLIQAGPERILLRMGQHVRARVDGEPRTSVVPIDRGRLLAVERQNGSFAELLGLDAAAS